MEKENEKLFIDKMEEMFTKNSDNLKVWKITLLLVKFSHTFLKHNLNLVLSKVL